MTRTSIAVMLLLLSAGSASAQIEECPGYRRAIDDVVAGRARAVENLTDVSQTPRCFAIFIAGLDRADMNAFKAFVKRLEGFRSDKQTTASPATGGTSIVAGGPVAKVLSFATEYGALTQSVKSQVVTVRGNLAGVPAALVNKDVFPYCVGPDAQRGFCVDGSLLSTLKRVSFSVSFDTARNQTVTVTPPAAPKATDPKEVEFEGTSHEISAFSARVELWNRRDASSAAFMKTWRAKVGAALDKSSADLLAASTFAEAVISHPDYDGWFTATAADIRNAGTDRTRIVAAFLPALDKLAVVVRAVPGHDEMVLDALNAYSRFFLAQDDLIDELAKKNVLAFEYTNNRPVGQPAMSNYRVILDLPFTTKTKLVANGAFTFYDTVPEGQTIAGRYRDAQFGAQVDHGLGKVAIIGPAVVSGAVYFQYQHAPALLKIDPTKPIPGVTFVGLPDDAKDVFVMKGNIVLFQGKLSLVPEGSSVKIPLSVTWSNRTELIDEPAFRGQIGVSYDLDSLFAGLTR